MAKGSMDIAHLGSGLGEPQLRVPAAQVGRHVRTRDARLLDEIERLTRIDRAELARVANKHEPPDASKVGQRYQAFLVVVRDHRGFVEDQHPVAERFLRLSLKGGISRIFQQRRPALEQPSQGHRGDAGIALQQLHQGVLNREPDDLLAFLAEDLRHGLQNTALARACYALDGDCPVGRGENQARSPFLACVEVDTVIDGSDRLDPCACFIAVEKGSNCIPPGFDRGENAMLASERIARG